MESGINSKRCRDAGMQGNGKDTKSVELKTDVFFCCYSASPHPRVPASLEAPPNFSSSKKEIYMSKKFIYTAVFTLLTALGLTACGSNVNKDGIDSVVIQIVEEANKNLPMMIDEQTKLETITALPGNKIRFDNMLIDISNEDINIETFENSMRPAIFSNVKTNPGLESFRGKKVTFVYHYSDKNGEKTAEFEFTPEDYK